MDIKNLSKLKMQKDKTYGPYSFQKISALLRGGAVFELIEAVNRPVGVTMTIVQLAKISNSSYEWYIHGDCYTFIQSKNVMDIENVKTADINFPICTKYSSILEYVAGATGKQLIK